MFPLAKQGLNFIVHIEMSGVFVIKGVSHSLSTP